MRVTVTANSAKRSSFDGVIYAPAGEHGSGDTYVKQANVYGAVVTGNLTLGNKGKAHFDRGLAEESIGLVPGVSRFEFLYVTEHQFRSSPQ